MTFLVGRDQLLTELQSSLGKDNNMQSSPKIILIEGEAGIGKTLLADKLCDADIVRRRFQVRYRISAHISSWDQIVRHLADEILGALHAKATVDELHFELITRVSKAPCLVCVDNLDASLVFNGLQSLISAWKNVRGSVLLLTGQQFPASFDCSYSKRVSLKGLSDVQAITNIIGPQIAQISSDSKVLDKVIEVTKGNPQKLLYLRWRAPKDAGELETFLTRFEADEREDKTNMVIEAIKTGLVRLDVPTEHFLALSCLRYPVFDETLPAFLWDRLGGGGTEFYVNVLNRLLSEGLLNTQETTSGVTERMGSRGIREFRLNATFHARLQKSFSKFVARERQAHIQFFLGEYFRHKFASKYELFLADTTSHQSIEKRTRFPMEELDAFVFHTIASGHVESVYSYAFTHCRLEWAHAAGSSLGLKQVLEMLCSGITTKLSEIRHSVEPNMQKRIDSLYDDAKNIFDDIQQSHSDASAHIDLHHFECIKNSIFKLTSKREGMNQAEARLEAMAASVHAELGRTNKDLNSYQFALEHFDCALEILRQPEIQKQLEAIGAFHLPADLDHYRGIVYSVTGQVAEALEAYFDGIKYATINNCFTARDAISMGYMAYDLKYYDIEAAYRLAKAAVTQAELMGDSIILSKNLCTLGSIQSFMNHALESTNSFASALDTLKTRDIREYCRIKIDSSVNDIFKSEFKRARADLEEVIEKFGETGDRRRIANAKAYLGIIEYHESKQEAGCTAVEGAFEIHYNMNSIRECIFDAMTSVWMRTSCRIPTRTGEITTELSTLSEKEKADIPSFVQEFLVESSKKPDLHVYVKFWRTYYLPTLLLLENN